MKCYQASYFPTAIIGATLIAVSLFGVSTSSVGASKPAANHLVSAFTSSNNGLETDGEIKEFINELRVKIAAGADVNASDSHGMTPLVYAVVGSSWSRDEVAVRRNQVVSFLLANGADVNAISGDGWHSLHYALIGIVGLQVNNPALVELLCRAGAYSMTKSLKRIKEIPLGTTPKELLQTLGPTPQVLAAFSTCQ